MVFLVSQFLFLFFGLLGLLVWASSEMPMAMREIAINTRRDPGGNPYVMIKVLSVCIKIFAVLIWIAGIGAIIAVSVSGSLSSLLSGGANL
jgi:hypothetical protein